MLGPSDFLQLLELLVALETARLTDAEKADVVAVLRENFLSQAHDPRLMAIVERLTAPPPVVAEAPKAKRRGG